MKIPKIALGAWAWGNDGTFGEKLEEKELKAVFDSAVKYGFNLWDTAYAYGMGESERILGHFIKGLDRNSYLISDKFTPQAADYSSSSPIEDMIEKQLEIMGLDRFDIYWIHNTMDSPKWITELAKYFEGKKDVPVIGVSNHNLVKIKEADEILKSCGLRLGAVQNHYSLINRYSENTGILDYCKDKKIYFFSYMVLEQGALSGKYDTTHPFPSGSARADVYNPILEKLENLNMAMKKIADEHNVSIAQVPVAWAIAKGTIPIVGMTKTQQVEAAAKACDMKLSDSEIKELERIASDIDVDAVRFWEKEMK